VDENPVDNAAAAVRAGRKWYVIQSKPRRERLVSEQLTSQGLEVFFPAVKVHPINPRAARERAYFPGYLFAHVDLVAVGVNKLRWMPAAVGLLEFGGEPAIVPETLIAQLRRRVASIQAAGGIVFADLKKGEPVKITSGPFAGYEAIFDLRLKGSERVRVLLELLRRQVTVELDAGAIRQLRGGEMDQSRRGSGRFRRGPD
jgi:transcriptional antiterminator RfaH